MLPKCLALLALLAGSTFAQPAAESPKNLQLFLLIGQSNMAGRGAVEGVDKEPIPHVYAFTKDLTWQPAIDPIHFDKPIAGVGLGRSFAKTLLDADPSASIGLIPAAVGGTTLDEWSPDGKLYADAVRRAKAAMASGKLRGILWHQGESDSSKEEKAKNYRERWAQMIQALRKDLGAPNVPVLVGELGEFLYSREKDPSPFARMVNEQLATIPLGIPNTAFVSSAGLLHKGDQLHFDSSSQREFGRRYALAYLSLDPTWWRKP